MYIFSGQFCMCMSYAFHMPVINFSISEECCPPMKSCLKLNCVSIAQHHYTAFIKDKNIYLFPAPFRPLPGFGGLIAAGPGSAGAGSAGSAGPGSAGAESEPAGSGSESAGSGSACSF